MNSGKKGSKLRSAFRNPDVNSVAIWFGFCKNVLMIFSEILFLKYLFKRKRNVDIR